MLSFSFLSLSLPLWCWRRAYLGTFSIVLQLPCLCSRIKITNKDGRTCRDHVNIFSVETLKPKEHADFVRGRRRTLTSKMEFCSPRLPDCLLLSVCIEWVKVLLDKNWSTTLVFLAFKLWSKSNLVNNISPWPGAPIFTHWNVSERLLIHQDFCVILRTDLTLYAIKPLDKYRAFVSTILAGEAAIVFWSHLVTWIDGCCLPQTYFLPSF